MSYLFLQKKEKRKRDQYCIVDGTSSACPLVAAKEALIKRKFENELNFSPAWMLSALTTTNEGIY